MDSFDCPTSNSGKHFYNKDDVCTYCGAKSKSKKTEATKAKSSTSPGECSKGKDGKHIFGKDFKCIHCGFEQK